LVHACIGPVPRAPCPRASCRVPTCPHARVSPASCPLPSIPQQPHPLRTRGGVLEFWKAPHLINAQPWKARTAKLSWAAYLVGWIVGLILAPPGAPVESSYSGRACPARRSHVNTLSLAPPANTSMPAPSALRAGKPGCRGAGVPGCRGAACGVWRAACHPCASLGSPYSRIYGG
jgi:hypothetical protein